MHAFKGRLCPVAVKGHPLPSDRMASYLRSLPLSDTYIRVARLIVPRPEAIDVSDCKC